MRNETFGAEDVFTIQGLHREIRGYLRQQSNFWQTSQAIAMHASIIEVQWDSLSAESKQAPSLLYSFKKTT